MPSSKPVSDLRINVWFGDPDSEELAQSMAQFNAWAEEIECGQLPLKEALARVWCDGFQHGSAAGERYASYRRHMRS